VLHSGGVGGLVWRLGTPGLRAVALGARVSPWVFVLHSGVLAGLFGVWGHPACALSCAATTK
jgi:hypothetical protein